jgi:hypothetical protein
LGGKAAVPRLVRVVGNQPNIEVEIAHIAGRQQRNVTREQLLALGMAPSSIDYRVKIGRLYRSYWAVYSVGCPPITPQEHAMAAVLAGGPGAALSHGSALTLWGIWRRWDRPFDVTVRLDRRPQGVRVHRNRLERRDITRHHGIPVTRLARTLLDQAPHMTSKSLTRAVNDGRLTSAVSLADLCDVIRRYPSHRGRVRLEAVIGITSERPTRSRFEDDFFAFSERYGLPQPQLNVMVCGYEVDALFTDEKVIVELDGWDYHSSRRSFEDDRERDADTTEAGFVTVRLTRRRFEGNPAREAQRLHGILDGRRAA